MNQSEDGEQQNAQVKPRPPASQSIEASVKRQWATIVDLWRTGYHAETSIERLEHYLEVHRVRIFEENAVDVLYDWQGDWAAASSYHDVQTDFVRNRNAYNQGLHALWKEWHDSSVSSLSQLSLEALRSMIVVNGAAILACLTLLSGQIEKPNPSALLAAKVMLFFALLSIIMMASGHLLSSIRMLELTSRVRGLLVGHIHHRKLYAITRYLRRHLDPVINRSNALIYSSIFIFAFSSVMCALIIIFDAAS